MLEYFPLRWFTDTTGEQVLLTNLCRRVAIPSEFKANSSLYMTYTVRDGETARDIAEKLYDSADMFWTIYLMNDIHDIGKQWPISSTRLMNYMIKEYGYEGMDEVKHYKDRYGNIVDLHGLRLDAGDLTLSDTQMISRYSLVATTVEEYEIEVNDKKRSIKLIDPDYISNFKTQIEAMFDD